MMKLIIVMFNIVVLIGLSSQTKADELQVAYKTFYSHVVKLNDDSTNALQFGFGFVNIHTKQLCEINSARISTQKQQLPIQVSAENRFTLPSEKALRLADALVILNLTEASNICDISVQLETKPQYLQSSYTNSELILLLTQYVAFFEDVGSFMSFMMPKVDGLRFQFSDKSLSTTLTNGMQVENGVLVVNADKLNMLGNVSLPAVPLRITAKTHK